MCVQLSVHWCLWGHGRESVIQTWAEMCIITGCLTQVGGLAKREMGWKLGDPGPIVHLLCDLGEVPRPSEH